MEQMMQTIKDISDIHERLEAIINGMETNIINVELTRVNNIIIGLLRELGEMDSLPINLDERKEFSNDG